MGEGRLVFAQREEVRSESRRWHVLVVDDDGDVHAATQLALRGVTILDGYIELVHAHAAKEALELLSQRGDGHFAVVLLDVVMESPSAGLDIINAIRNDLGIAQTRIVIRTGQPGLAPDIDVIQKYEIDDYRTKTELTRGRLITTLAASIRAFQQLGVLNQHRKGLERVVRGAASLTQRKGVSAFAGGVLEQLAAVLKLPIDGIVCAQRESRAGAEIRVLSAAGELERLRG